MSFKLLQHNYSNTFIEIIWNTLWREAEECSFVKGGAWEPVSIILILFKKKFVCFIDKV